MSQRKEKYARREDNTVAEAHYRSQVAGADALQALRMAGRNHRELHRLRRDVHRGQSDKVFWVTVATAMMVTSAVCLWGMYIAIQHARTVTQPTSTTAPVAVTEYVALAQLAHPVELEPVVDCPLTIEDYSTLRTACDASGVPLDLALAVIGVESNYRNVEGDGGQSLGYMQVQPKWHQERMDRLGVTDLLDPASNFAVGCDYLGELLHKYGDTHKALMAYNMGPSGAAKLWAQGVTTSRYSRAVVGA